MFDKGPSGADHSFYRKESGTPVQGLSRGTGSTTGIPFSAMPPSSLGLRPQPTHNHRAGPGKHEMKSRENSFFTVMRSGLKMVRGPGSAHLWGPLLFQASWSLSTERE